MAARAGRRKCAFAPHGPMADATSVERRLRETGVTPRAADARERLYDWRGTGPFHPGVGRGSHTPRSTDKKPRGPRYAMPAFDRAASDSSKCPWPDRVW